MKEFIEKLIERFAENRRPIVTNDEDLEWNRAMYLCTGIVNQLAEEYNNDFCEWKEDKNFNWFFKSPHEGVGIVKEESGLFNFCPYCGKKIKVASYQPKGE